MTIRQYEPMTYRYSPANGPRFRTIVIQTLDTASDPYPFGEPIEVQVTRINYATMEVEYDLEGIEIHGTITDRNVYGIAAFSELRLVALFSSINKAAYYFERDFHTLRNVVRSRVSQIDGLSLRRVGVDVLKPIFEHTNKNL